MRELRFRCFWIRRKKMYPVEIISNGGACALLTTGKTHRWVVRGIEIMQSTGLKDKNGKEIYEGDIVEITLLDVHNPVPNAEYDDECSPKVKNTCEIRWRNSAGFIAIVKTGKYRGKALRLKNASDEVIGNIYEDPDLLKEATK